MAAGRLLIRTPDGWLDRLDDARGDMSRSEFVRRAAEAQMDGAGRGGPKQIPVKGRRAKRSPAKRETELPKIAKAHWKT